MSPQRMVLTLLALLGAAPGHAQGGAGERTAAPVLTRTFPLEGVRGPADRTGIPGRLDHMAYDPATHRLFVACVANGSLEAIDLDSGTRAGTVAGLREPQGVAVLDGSVYVSTGGDARIHRFNARTLSAGETATVGDDADNVRVGRDRRLWVSFGGEGPGGFASFDAGNLAPGRKLNLPRMPEGFQLHPTGEVVFANLPAGKRSTKDGSVVALSRTDGSTLWETKFSGRAGNFPMALDAANGRVFVVTRRPPRLISLKTSDGSILGESPCPPESDDLFHDARSGRVAVIGGGTLPTPGDPGGLGASLDLFVVDGSGRPERSTGTPLRRHSRTGTLILDRRRLYVGAPATENRPAEVREYRLPD